MTPIERIKVVLQTQGTSPGISKGTNYKGPLDATLGIIKTEGIRGIYKGTLATLWRDVPGSVAYFGSYEMFKSMFVKDSDNSVMNVVGTLTAGSK